jgi:GT2 family glycosyltransferase
MQKSASSISSAPDIAPALRPFSLATTKVRGMSNESEATVFIPNFDEERYLSANPDVRKWVDSGKFPSGYQHFLDHGIDEDRSPRLMRASLAVPGAVERAFVSDSGFFLVLGWLSDEGCARTQYKLIGAEFIVDISPDAVLRYVRKDVETSVRDGAFDFGFLMFGKCPSRFLLQQPFLVRAASETALFEAGATPELLSDKRLLDMLLTIVATSQSHAGKEADLFTFFASPAGRAAVDLFRGHVVANAASHYVRTFRPRPVTRSFVSVLFGSTEAMLVQPVVFRKLNIDFGEWIYVCNSPEDANAALRVGRLISDLYDVMITVIVMPDNVGFGAANNVAVGRASSDSIYLVNPDVLPIRTHSETLRKTLRDRDLGTNLWGGLLFYDDHNLMHSGMRVEWDSFFRRTSFSRHPTSAATSFDLARVEHFDKGVPFVEDRWQSPKVVPAVTGAFMGFRKSCFERIGGFSTRYIYGHYEDADLSLRWPDANGSVLVDPGLRLIHLEGQGSRVRGEQYRGAAMANRYLFSLEHPRSPETDNVVSVPRFLEV